jgi:hypothetical protein
MEERACAFCSLVTRPYHDDLAAMRARIAVLEQAERGRSCAMCAERTLARHPPFAYRVVATILGLLALVVAFGAYAACSSPVAIGSNLG